MLGDDWFEGSFASCYSYYFEIGSSKYILIVIIEGANKLERIYNITDIDNPLLELDITNDQTLSNLGAEFVGVIDNDFLFGIGDSYGSYTFCLRDGTPYEYTRENQPRLIIYNDAYYYISSSNGTAGAIYLQTKRGPIKIISDWIDQIDFLLSVRFNGLGLNQSFLYYIDVENNNAPILLDYNSGEDITADFQDMIDQQFYPVGTY